MTDTTPGSPETPPHVLLRNERLAVAIAVCLTAGAVAVSVLVAAARSAVQPVDDAVTRFLVDHRDSVLSGIGRVLNLLGSGIVLVPLRVAAALWLAMRRRWWLFGALVGAWIGSQVASSVMKGLYDRPRPSVPLLLHGIHTTGSSYPSGHAVATAATVVSLVLVLAPAAPGRLRWELGAIAVSLVMAASRVYLGAHWLSDVLGGVLVGGAIALWTAVIVQLVRDRRAERARERPEQVPRPDQGPLEPTGVFDPPGNEPKV